MPSLSKQDSPSAPKHLHVCKKVHPSHCKFLTCKGKGPWKCSSKHTGTHAVAHPPPHVCVLGPFCSRFNLPLPEHRVYGARSGRGQFKLYPGTTPPHPTYYILSLTARSSEIGRRLWRRRFFSLRKKPTPPLFGCSDGWEDWRQQQDSFCVVFCTVFVVQVLQVAAEVIVPSRYGVPVLWGCITFSAYSTTHHPLCLYVWMVWRWRVTYVHLRDLTKNES